MTRVCPKGHRHNALRCPACERQRSARRGSREQQGYGRAHRVRRAEAIAEEPWCHGTPKGPCPYPDAGTERNRLTGGHSVAIIRGGRDSALTVQCLRCNSGQRDRHG